MKVNGYFVGCAQSWRRKWARVRESGLLDRTVTLGAERWNKGDTRESNLTYQLRMGIFRVVCTNGLIVSQGAFPAYCVSHRGNVVNEVIAGALKICEQFDTLAVQVERMERRRMLKDEQLRFAEAALALRYPEPAVAGMQPSQLLTCRRAEDLGDNLWVLLNRIQEHLCRGGLSRWSPSGRLVRMRRLTSIKRDVQLNGQLWDLATEVLAA